ncbi:transposase [Streptomyces sp. NPDC055186]
MGTDRTAVAALARAVAGSAAGGGPALPAEQGILYVFHNDMARQLPPLELGFGSSTGPPPVDRRKTGSKHSPALRRTRTPLEALTTPAHVNAVTQTLALVDGMPPVVVRPGRPRRRPEALLGDKGYDSTPPREELHKRLIPPVASRKGAPNLKGLSTLRYTVEQTFAPLQPVRTTGRPSETPHRTPRCLCPPGLQPDLLETTQGGPAMIVS